MEQQFLPQLLTVEYPNISWRGEKLFVRTTWKNTGASAGFSGKIRLSFEYFNLRSLRSECNDMSFTFVPFPHCYDWSTDGVYTVGGSYKIPHMWGGARKIYLTLLDDEEMPVPFIGRGGNVVRREYIGQINFDWKRPSDAMIGQVHPMTVSFEESPEEIAKPKPETFAIGEAVFHRDFPGLYQYRGELLDSYRPRILVRDVEANRVFAQENGKWEVVCRTEDEVRYRFVGMLVSLEMVCSLGKEEIELRLENVSESEGAELIAVEYAHLISLGGEKNFLVNLYSSGRLVDAHKTWQMGCTFPFDVDNFSGMYNENLCVALQASSLDTVLCDSIEGSKECPLTVLGAKLHYRVVNEQKGQPSLPVKAKVGVTLRFAQGGDWQTIAKILRKDLKPQYDPIYRNALVSKWMLDNGSDGVKYTLEDVKKNVRTIAELTDHLPQIVYIVGWQKDGHDHWYPVPKELNAGIPSEEVLKETIREYREKYNAYLSFHDNFDDAYWGLDFDHSIIATDQFGEPYKGWMWGGQQSYIISPKRYVTSGLMAKRVKEQVERLGLSGSYHIDVVTSETRRYDYSPDMMAAADENMEYKKAILAEFAKYGVDVTSEVLAVPTLGQMSYSWHIRADSGSVYYRDEEIPLTPMLYHGVAGYNLPSDCKKENILEAMIYGAQNVTSDLTGYEEEHLFAYYSLSIPVRQFAMMEIQRFDMAEDMVRAVYGEDSFIEVHPKAKTYTIQLNGRVLGKDWVTMVPVKEDVCLAYAPEEGEYEFLLPEGWKGATAVQLTAEGPGDSVTVKISGRAIVVPLQAGVPVKIKKA